MRFISGLIISITLITCKKQSDSSVLVFGHAGMGLEMQNSIYHDNSFEAVELCLLMPNSNGVEVDIQMDKNGCLWLYHDEFLEKITSISGCINDKTTSELENVYYRTLKKEKLAKLDQILPLIGTGQKLLLDIKNKNACSNSTVNIDLFKQSLSNLLETSNSNINLILSDPTWLNEFDDLFSCYYSSDLFSEANELIIQNQKIDGIVIRNKAIKKEEIDEIKKIGKEIILFDIRSPKGNREAINKNPNGLITDDIRAALIERGN